jgi:lipopolysaccharide export system protein LptA
MYPKAWHRFLLPLMALLYCLSAGVSASTEDTRQPINIEADRAEISELKGTSTYSGHVVLNQGGIEVKADTVTVYANEGQLQRITAEGQPVQYRQQRPGEEDIHGVSQRMEYTADGRQLLLLDDAELWQGGNRFSGNRIHYDPKSERVIATSKDGGQGAQRVTVTLQPKTVPKPAPEPAPNTPAPAAGDTPPGDTPPAEQP